MDGPTDIPVAGIKVQVCWPGKRKIAITADGNACLNRYGWLNPQPDLKGSRTALYYLQIKPGGQKSLHH